MSPRLPTPSLRAKDVFSCVNALVEPAVRRGWLAPAAAGAGLVSLETTGRRSGRPVQRPVLAVRVGDRVAVATVRRRSDWVANLLADPSPTVTVRGARRAAEADVYRSERGGSVAVLRLGPPRSG
jgi:deazaflavin-dependent oxidoreductase (nitroreductase family)